MKTSAIICEYNPFHNGHAYQIEKTRELGATHIIAVMSGNFVQRGETALVSKHKRAEAAVKCGADLVIELPVPYSISSAELFAKGAVSIINSLGVVDTLSFGTESGNADKLLKASQIALEFSDSEELRQLIATGLSYPLAMCRLIEEKYGEEVSELFKSPNNVLAIEYLKSLSRTGSSVKPFTIARKNVEHDSMNSSDEFASASLLRKSIKSRENIIQYIPPICNEIIMNELSEKNIAEFQNLDTLVKYRFMTMTDEELKELPDADNGLYQRLVSASYQFNTTNEIIESAKTKCYTMARIRRVICYALLGIKKSDFDIMPPYARILGFNEKGLEIMSQIKKKSSIPVLSSLSQLRDTSEQAKRFAYLDELASQIFSMATDNKKLVLNEYKTYTKLIKN